MINYGRQTIDDEDISSVIEVMKSDFLTQGPKLQEFESALASYTGARFCVAVSNGTAALHIAVAALEIPENKKGIVSPITFVASSNAMLYSKILPEFVDIDPRNICMSAKYLKENIDDDVALVMPVHFAGFAAELPEINKISREYSAFIIEDAAHSIGSSYDDGSKVGCCKYSDLTTFSFHPVKTMTTGEGGAITTNDSDLYNRLILLRNHGITKNHSLLNENPGQWYYEMQALGFNYRLTEMQASLGLSQLKKLDMFASRRQDIVDFYNHEFKDLKYLVTPASHVKRSTAYHLYVVQIDFEKLGKKRDMVMSELRDMGVGTQVHYIPVYKQPYYRKYVNTENISLLNAENYYDKCLSLPLFPTLSDGDAAYVVKCVKQVLGIH